MTPAMSRDRFRDSVFARDQHRCVVCGEPAADAHHILERRLWSDGGYHLDNGASLCATHHRLAESTELSCEEVRRAARIERVLLPEHLDEDQLYDKWANPILANGQRLRGELFHDENVQKALGPVLDRFTALVKYPRTYHLPWSPGVAKSDRVMADTRELEQGDVVVSLKMDGEQITMYSDDIHSRSVDSARSPAARDWVKGLHGRIAHDIPKGWRICGENLYAKHNVHYRHLPDFFLLFSVWDDRNVCLSWYETVLWAELLGLRTVPVLYAGPWDEVLLRSMHRAERHGDPCEGYVVRTRDSFAYSAFRRRVGKYVRAGHVPMHGGGPLIRNERDQE